MTGDTTIPSVVLPENGRIAIVAGSGSLPIVLAATLTAAGHEPLVVMISGEADESLRAYHHENLKLEHMLDLPEKLKKRGVAVMVLAGGLSRRPRIRDIRFGLNAFSMIPRLMRSLALGDDAALRRIIEHIESRGIRVVGPHQLVPDLLADVGALGRKRPNRRDLADIDAALKAARLLGNADIGQGAVAIRGRVIAVEAAEGTAGMLARVAELRRIGRVSATRPGVLVKCAKPQQELRADLPAIGPDTVTQALEAGLAGIAVEAGRALVLEHDETVERADKAGLFIYGLDLVRSR